MRVNPDGPKLPVLLGRALMGSGNLQEAEKVLRKRAVSAPDDVNARLYLAAALSEQGKKEEAVPPP